MRTDEPAEGPRIADSWVTSRRAVLAFASFCLDVGWVFTETPEQTDFGKDGYLDFAKDGSLTGQCIAIQVKGGVSHRASGEGYRITARERTRNLWRQSTVPVFAVVWDPDHGLHWLDVTTALRVDGAETSLVVPPENRCDVDDLTEFVEAMWYATESDAVSPALGSSDRLLQSAAAFDCLGLGRRDPRYLILLRRVMFSLQPGALDDAIWVLNQCSLNTDLFKDPKWMSMTDRTTVRRHFDWTDDETIALLDRVQDEGFERGSFSLCIYWLLVADDPHGDSFVHLVERALLRAAKSGRPIAAQWGLVLRVYWAAENGRDVYDRLVDSAPVLAEGEVAAQVRKSLEEFGHIEIG